MFSIFNKTRNQKLFNGLIDFHNHILPGIDDGSKSADESLEMLDVYEALGIEKVFASPHIYKDLYPNTAEEINDSFESFSKASKNHKVILSGYLAEYMIDEYFLNDIEKKKKFLTFFGNHVLVEMPFFGDIKVLNKALFLLQTEGYCPILAHPERYTFIQNEGDIKKIKRSGVKMQLNALSLIGFYSKDSEKKARLFLRNGLYDSVCTDAHNVFQLKKLEKIKLNDKELKAWKLICEKHHHLTSV